MDIERIDTLLDKYWNCETTVSEESELQAFFNSNRVPQRLQPFAPLFVYRQSLQAMTLPAGFQAEVEGKRRAARKESRYVTIKIFEPLLRIAASVLLVLSIGAAAYLFIQRDNQHFAETYNDPDAAIKQAALALEKISLALQVSEEASIRSLESLEGLDLNWAILDSLSSQIPLHNPDLYDPAETVNL